MAGFRSEEGNIQDEPGALIVPERKEVLQTAATKCINSHFLGMSCA